jgi:hypothetical protein
VRSQAASVFQIKDIAISDHAEALNPHSGDHH